MPSASGVWLRRARRLVQVAVVAYVLVVAAVYLGQRRLQYEPARSSPGTPEAAKLPQARRVQVRTADGLDLFAWYAPPASPSRPVILFFHGNSGHIGHRAFKARRFVEEGYGFYMCEYRGYGGNPGSPSEEGLYADGRAALSWLAAEGLSPERLVVYGQSIGTGVATQIAVEAHPRALVLEAPFTSIVDVARDRFFWLPVGLLIEDRFDSIAKIGQVHAPVLVLHGDADTVVPYRLGRELFEAAAEPKKFVTFPGGGHSDLHRHGGIRAVLEWLARD